MPDSQIFFGCRDLNEFLKGKRKLEQQQTQENQKQYIFCGVRDLNKFLKGSRLLEIDQDLTATPQNFPSGIRSSMPFCSYCCFPILLILASIDREIWIFLAPNDIAFILWIISFIPFILAMFLIWLNSSQNRYKIIISIFLICFVLDLATFLYFTIDLFTIPYYWCEYDEYQHKTCYADNEEFRTLWFQIKILPPTLVIYICLFMLVCFTYRNRPKSDPKQQRYLLQQTQQGETNRTNVLDS